MLIRTAAQRQKRRASQIISANFARLHLPWLAPAQLRWHASRVAPKTASPARTQAARQRSSVSQARCLATAVDSYPMSPDRPSPPPGFSIKYQQVAKEADRSRRTEARPQSVYEFESLRQKGAPFISLAASNILNPDPVLTIQTGVNGSLETLLQHLHVSIRIGRIARAESIVRRLAEQTSPSAPEVIYAHILFLETMLHKIDGYGRDEESAKSAFNDMQRWFEVSIRAKGTPLTERMVVLMIKASITALPQPRRDRAIRRYTDLARNISQDLFDNVTQSEELDDDEFVIVGRATSQMTTIPDELNSSSQEQDGDITKGQNDVISPTAATEQTMTSAETAGTITSRRPLPLPRAVNQQGRGLDTIKYVLGEFAKVSPAPSDATDAAKHEIALARQKALEETSVEAAIKNWQKSSEELRKIGIHTVMQTKPMAALLWQWQEALVLLLREEVVEVQKALDNNPAHGADRRMYGPYLELLPVEKLAATTILYAIAMFSSIKMSSGSWDSFLRVGVLTTGLGDAVQQEAAAEFSKQRSGAKKAMPGNRRRPRKTVHNTAASETENIDDHLSNGQQLSLAQLAVSEWPKDVVVKLGALLLSKLTEAAQLPVTRKHPRTGEMITQMQPAFMHRVKYIVGKKAGVIAPNPALMEKMKSEPYGSAIAKRMPMIVPPRPWTDWKEGGYLRYPTPIARMAGDDGTGRRYFMAALAKGDLDQVLAGLNALGQVPWRVDQDVLKVQLEAWNSGEAVGNFAPNQPTFDFPTEPEPSADSAVRRRWLREVAEVEHKRSGFHSKRCFQNFQLEIARAMADETLYFPHNIDFRGRAYPIPPYLNHMGADNVRGVLLFAEGKPLGKGGLRWLKIHLATVAGYDKASLEERVAFTEKHLDDIYDSTRRPLDGRRWWLKAEDAWQTLAACFELTRALDAPDPTQFVSHLPIHQDGTCNGLQHYAALGGDEAGARQVNLEPGDRPSDVYTAVADAVREEVRRDAEAGNPIAMKLHGRITRKCVKQPVMTNVYGVTFFGAKAQVQKQLEDLFPEVGLYGEVNLTNMSFYMVTKIFRCFGDLFRGAQAIQEWLGVCAGRISTYLTPEQIKNLSSKDPKPQPKGHKKVGRPKSKGSVTVDEEGQSLEILAGDDETVILKKTKPLFKSTVVWTTPLGIPVAQPYRVQKVRSISTNLQLISINEPQTWHPVSKRKQLQAFPPNFIHSLDATHMLLSAAKCTEIGLTFASVHDSFWTHACDVDTLSSVLRDAFVKIHSDDIIVRLREEFMARYKDGMYLGSLDVSVPTAEAMSLCRRQIAKSGLSELSQEAERMRLLNSSVAADREAGQAMITPGNIATKEAGASGSQPPSELNGHRLGNIPVTSEPTIQTDSTGFGIEATNSDADISAEAYVDDADSEHEASEAAEGDEHELDGEAEEEGSRDHIVQDQIQKRKSQASKSDNEPRPGTRRVLVWLPMAFPEVPAKGTFDVSRLRLSKYFFH